MKTRQEIIEQINAGILTLSYSSVKAFAKSPKHFIDYKTDVIEPTESMLVGQLQHMFILQPELVSKNFLFLEKAIGYQENTWTKKENADHKATMIEQAQKEGKILLDQKHLDNAYTLSNSIAKNKFALELLLGLEEREKEVFFDFEGYNFKGVIDGISNNYIIDLKKVPDATPQKLKWTQREMKYSWQAYLYGLATGRELGEFYNICYDDNYNVTVIKQDVISQAGAKNELKELMSKFNECVILDSWEQGFEFYTDQGFYLSSEI